MEESLNNFTEVMKEIVCKFIEIVKESFERITIWIMEKFYSKDYDNYKFKYKKYQKRVKNRKILYAKRKAKYGK